MSATTTRNPNAASNRLNSGEITTLPEAVAAVREEVRIERDWHRMACPHGIDADFDAELDDLEQRALTAKLLYEHGQERGMSDDGIADLLADVGLNEWAEALLAADYSGMAI